MWLALLAAAPSPLSSSASEELHYCPISTLAGSILWIGCQQIVIKYKDKLSTVKALCLTLY